MDELAARGADFELHYAYRSPEHAALLDELKQNIQSTYLVMLIQKAACLT